VCNSVETGWDPIANCRQQNRFHTPAESGASPSNSTLSLWSARNV
jgi:hypothetical protein